MDDVVKTQILTLFDQLKPDQRVQIARIAWNAYDALFDQVLDANLDLQFEKVGKGEEHFGKDYYAKALRKTEKDMTTNLEQTISQVDLIDARRAMERILKEIESAKKN